MPSCPPWGLISCIAGSFYLLFDESADAVDATGRGGTDGAKEEDTKNMRWVMPISLDWTGCKVRGDVYDRSKKGTIRQQQMLYSQQQQQVPSNFTGTGKAEWK